MTDSTNPVARSQSTSQLPNFRGYSVDYLEKQFRKYENGHCIEMLHMENHEKGSELFGELCLEGNSVDILTEVFRTAKYNDYLTTGDRLIIETQIHRLNEQGIDANELISKFRKK